ncbi:cation transporter [Coriobacteriia bacterium Es71-Z0120]|uniref:heavy-metal-associated domain-containing protein n=1 Tax=Parvivirga hydrogeniphila TaxID=2939460 RepID=UPI00226087A4|nr:heavy-metal-associated domain-containing protein [Parvivirga hydrogeniphila]MCL4078903.1 cation transporter [Parvivirga hydrogeniphila]
MAETVSVEIPTRGMHCRSCESLIELTLGDLDGVISAKADRSAEATSVTYDPARVDVQAIVEAIRSAGYEASAPE